MAIFRTVQMSFWTDADLMDDFTPEDKYFYLYLITNPHTNLAGCYEISIKNIEMETGYSSDTVKKLLIRMEREHKKIIYHKATKELLIVNWNKFNWNNSPKFRKSLEKEIEHVKNPDFKEYLAAIYNGMDTVSIPYASGMDTTVTVTDTDTVTVTVSDTVRKQRKRSSNKQDTRVMDISREIIEYLNGVAGTRYEPDSKATVSKIKKRIDEGRTVDDFKKVIDNKAAEWLSDPKMRGFLRPNTLFCDEHFEEYLNQSHAVAVDSEEQKRIDFEKEFDFVYK